MSTETLLSSLPQDIQTSLHEVVDTDAALTNTERSARFAMIIKRTPQIHRPVIRKVWYNYKGTKKPQKISGTALSKWLEPTPAVQHYPKSRNDETYYAKYKKPIMQALREYYKKLDEEMEEAWTLYTTYLNEQRRREEEEREGRDPSLDDDLYEDPIVTTKETRGLPGLGLGSDR